MIELTFGVAVLSLAIMLFAGKIRITWVADRHSQANVCAGCPLLKNAESRVPLPMLSPCAKDVATTI